MPEFDFLYEETPFKLQNIQAIEKWLTLIADQENVQIEQLSYIFCSDDYLLEINKNHLQHDYYTDIITFDNSLVDATEIIGDIFISIDRVKENASHFGVAFENELTRVMAHGLLHLCGYGDKSNEEQKLMRQKEDACISLLKN